MPKVYAGAGKEPLLLGRLVYYGIVYYNIVYDNAIVAFSGEQ